MISITNQQLIYPVALILSTNRITCEAMASFKSKKKMQIHARKPRKLLIPEWVSIHDRPEAINKTSEFGHLEGDLTFCKGNRLTF